MASQPDPAALGRAWVASYPPGVPPTYRLPEISLTRLLDDAARDFPEHIGLELGRLQLPFADLRREVDALASALGTPQLPVPALSPDLPAEDGDAHEADHAPADLPAIAAGERILVVMPPGFGLPIVLLALWRLGAVAVPVPRNADPDHLRDLVTDSEVVGVIGSAGALKALLSRTDSLRFALSLAGDEWDPKRRPGPARLASAVRLPRPGRWASARRARRAGRATDGDRDPMPQTLTLSVTELRTAMTGALPVRPVVAPDAPALLAVRVSADGWAGVEHTHATLLATAFQSRLWIPDVQAGRERVLIGEPLHDLLGLAAGLLAALLSGATSILSDDPSPADLARSIERSKPTLLLARSGRIARLLDEGDGAKRDLTSLRVCLAFGEDLAPQIARDLEKRAAGARVRPVYGCGDVAPITHGQPVYGRVLASAIGLPVTSTIAAIVAAEDLGVLCEPEQVGLLLLQGPQIPEVGIDAVGGHTVDGWLVTDLLARVSADGWFTVVGPRDQVVAIGGELRCPPRLVAVLERHPNVRAAAVVAVDERLVAAVVGARRRPPDPDGLQAHLLGQFDAAAVPDALVVVDELPRRDDGTVDEPVLAASLRETLAADTLEAGDGGQATAEDPQDPDAGRQTS